MSLQGQLKAECCVRLLRQCERDTRAVRLVTVAVLVLVPVYTRRCSQV